MENWSYRIKEFWLLNKREIKRYGFCALLVYSGVVQNVYFVAWAGLLGALVMLAFDRWGRPWAERGAALMNRKPSDPPQA